MTAPPESINLGNSPPQLGEIPQHSEMHVPTLSSTNGNASMQNAKDAITHAQSAYNAVANHPATQNFKDTVRPVAESVKDQHAKTTSEFNNLAGARTTPDTKTATGQPLTHYHSFFYSLLSWENPRATAISYLAIVLFIFGARYLPALRWSFKMLWMTLGIAASAEIAGKLVLNQGLASSFRPRKYYTIPRESLESTLEDVEQLINFYVIEFQRLLFAENVLHTIAAFAAALIAHGLIKVLPLWGLSLIGVSVIYFAPLIYINNREIIDHHVANASNVVNSQASQMKDLAGHHTARLTETVKAQTSTYSAKAQEYMGTARDRSAEALGNAKAQTSAAIGTAQDKASSATNSMSNQTSATVGNAQEKASSATNSLSNQTSAAMGNTQERVNSGTNSINNNPFTSGPGASPSYSSSDFPHAPKQEPTPGVTPHEQQYERSRFGGQAEMGSY
ncbi:hypothetical protein MMC13_006071 [Lambiella insularis]|nr:hypothetical protein [Lambiella insularis]